MNVKKSDRLYKSDRLNYIVNRMRVCQDITPTMLAEELHVSERTVYRDLRNLEKGNTLQKRYSRREGRYLLETELNLPPLTLTPSEALALFTSAANAALSSDNFFAVDLRSGLQKVANILTAEAGQQIAPDRKTLESSVVEGRPAKEGETAKDASAETDGKAENSNPTDRTKETPVRFAINSDSIQRPTLETIRRAMRSNYKLHLLYWSPASDSERSLLVAPYDLREVGKNWYLLANSEEHGTTRPFRISRIRKVQIATERFRYPRRFSADAFFDRAWKQFGDSDEAINVVVRFAPSVANLVRDSRGHLFSELVYEENGALVCTAPVNSVKEISWWILSYGSRAEVLSPPELRAQFAQTVQELTSLYAQPPAPVVSQELSSVLQAPAEESVQAVVRAVDSSMARR